MSGADGRYLRCVPIIAKNHDNELMQALHKQQQSGNLCDVWLVIENERFAAHKAVLASFSSYFNALFENGHKSDVAGSKACNVKEIVLSSVEKSTFLPIMHFLYTSRLHVFKENLCDILRTARKLQIASIVEICNKLIEDDVVLPTLSDADKSVSKLELEVDKRSKNNILYVDLSDCAEEEAIAKEPTPDSVATYEVQNDSSPEHESSLEFEKPSTNTHSNGWTMSSCDSSCSSSTRSVARTSGKVPEHFQVKSVYSIAPNTRNKKVTAVVTNASAACSSIEPSFVQNITKPPKSACKKILRDEARLSCSYCGKFFSKKANLKRHILIKHSSVHQYSCPKCGKTYAIEQSLQYHMSASKCSKTSLTSLLDDLSPLTGMHPQEMHSAVTCSINMPALESPSSREASADSSQKISSSNTDISASTSYLQHALPSTSVDEAISLAMPATTLFPSIANLDEPAFDRLDTSSPETSLYKLSQDSYPHYNQSNTQEQNATNSDDGMPTISRVQSMREPFMEDTNKCDTGIHGKVDGSSTMTEEPSVTSCTVSDQQEPAQPDTTTSTTVETDPEVANLIRIAPKTSLMTSMKKHSSESRMGSHRERVPILVQNPLDVSSLAGLFNLSAVEGSRLQYGQPSSASLHHFISSSHASSTASLPSTSTTYINVDQLPRCLVCGRIFPSFQALNEHKRKCCKCQFCNRVFSQYSNMKRHIDIFHTKQKPHKCGVCGRAYGIKQSLRLHMQTKHGIPYVARKYNRNRRPKMD